MVSPGYGISRKYLPIEEYKKRGKSVEIEIRERGKSLRKRKKDMKQINNKHNHHKIVSNINQQYITSIPANYLYSQLLRSNAKGPTIPPNLSH